MKRIDECMDMTVLVALLVVGILLVMGAYRIFSFLCEHAALDARTFLLGAACLLLAVVGLLRQEGRAAAPPQLPAAPVPAGQRGIGLTIGSGTPEQGGTPPGQTWDKTRQKRTPRRRRAGGC